MRQGRIRWRAGRPHAGCPRDPSEVSIGGSPPGPGESNITPENAEEYGEALKGKLKSSDVFACNAGWNDVHNSSGQGLLEGLAKGACVDVCGYSGCVVLSRGEAGSMSEQTSV